MGCRRQRQIELAVGCTCTGSYFCLSSLPLLELARMMSLAVFCNEQMKFALVEDDPSFDLQEVASRTERNMRNCVRLAIIHAQASLMDHTLYILINNKFWLKDPLAQIQEATEAAGGRVGD
jgi:mannose-1-phosphate guanylyltransferase